MILPMKINIRDAKELDLLLESLAFEIIQARILYRMYCGLIDDMQEYEDDMNHSPGFWHYTLTSLRETSFLGLCRIYDQHAEGLNLHNLLETIRDNPQMFATDEFKKRLKDNKFVESLAAESRTPQSKNIAEHLRYASEENPIVKKLIVWRNNIVAHRGAKLSLGRKDILNERQIPEEEINELLDQALKIFNHYSYLFKASTWSSKAIGEDDYKNCLQLLRAGILQKKQTFLEAARANQKTCADD